MLVVSRFNAILYNRTKSPNHVLYTYPTNSSLCSRIGFGSRIGDKAFLRRQGGWGEGRRVTIKARPPAPMGPLITIRGWSAVARYSPCAEIFHWPMGGHVQWRGTLLNAIVRNITGDAVK